MLKSAYRSTLALCLFALFAQNASANLSTVISEDDKLLSKATSAKILYTAPIEPDLMAELVSAIDEINISFPHLKNIYLYINSDGGDMDSGQIGYWAVKSSTIPVTTVNLSMVGSSATIVYCGADKRASLPNGKFLLHASSLVSGEGQMLRPDDIANLQQESALYRKVFFDTYQACTNYSESQLDKILHSEGTRALIDTQQAQSVNMVNAITHKIEQTPIVYYITQATQAE